MYSALTGQESENLRDKMIRGYRTAMEAFRRTANPDRARDMIRLAMDLADLADDIKREKS